MKKILQTAIIIGCITSFISVAHATVGGPSFIYDFLYNPADESVYYMEKSFGGRGCPPELIKTDLKTGVRSVAYSCDTGEEFLRQQPGSPYNSGLVNAEINKITSEFKRLTEIDLNKNNIQIDVDFEKTENYSPEWDEVMRTHFIASIYQLNEKIDEIAISGCSIDQPFTFAGYAVPGFEKKIMLLLSTKGDCFEGGYTEESLHIVNNVQDIDREYYPSEVKYDNPLVPSVATIVTFESEEVSTPNPDIPVENEDTVTADIDTRNISDQAPENVPKDTPEKRVSLLVMILLSIIALLIGIIVGRILPRNHMS